jgi:MFS family permease
MPADPTALPSAPARPPEAPGAPEAFAETHLRHNAVALGLDYGLFLVGLSFASQSTILPAFAAHLGASSTVIGAIPAVMTLGWFLPSLFAAGHTEALPRKMPFVLRWTIWERVPFLVLALAAFFLADRAPTLTLIVLLAMLAVITGTGGVLMPAWMDVIGRTIPTGLRGRFFAAGSLFGNLGGLAGSAVVTWVLATVAPPAGYGVCFLASALCMAVSFVALALTREPANPAPAPAVSLGAYLRRMPAVMRRDRNLCWLLLARAVTMAGTMATGFYAVCALQVFAAPAWQVGVFTASMLAGQIVGNVVLGWLADRFGHRVSITLGVAATVAANLVAFAAPSLGAFNLVFALSGVYHAATNVSGHSILLELAPTPGERPTYVGLGNTLSGPVAFMAPLAAGLAVDRTGYFPVFAVAATFGIGALAVLLLRVREPRIGLPRATPVPF